VAVTYTSQLPSRMEAFDFSRPFGEEKWMIMMSRPQETTDGDGLIAPFQPEVSYQPVFLRASLLIVHLFLLSPSLYDRRLQMSNAILNITKS